MVVALPGDSDQVEVFVPTDLLDPDEHGSRPDPATDTTPDRTASSIPRRSSGIHDPLLHHSSEVTRKTRGFLRVSCPCIRQSVEVGLGARMTDPDIAFAARAIRLSVFAWL